MTTLSNVVKERDEARADVIELAEKIGELQESSRLARDFHADQTTHIDELETLLKRYL